MPGSPSSYSQPVADEVCRRIADGKALEAICRDPAMPHVNTIRRWGHRLPGFADALARARAQSAQNWVPVHAYSPELADAICARVAAGETMKAICAEPQMPGAGTVYYWLQRHADFAAGYRRAWDLRAAADLGPLAYREEIADAFCARIAAGELVRKVCAQPGMPQPGTIYWWVHHRPDFAAKYERARELRRTLDGSFHGYSEAVADELCQRLLDGESVGEICADPMMPALATVQTWRRRRPDFAERFEAARKLAIEAIEDRMLQVINTVTSETASADRVRLAALVALASRLDKSAPRQTWEPLTVRFVDGPGEDYYDDIDERERGAER